MTFQEYLLRKYNNPDYFKADENLLRMLEDAWSADLQEAATKVESWADRIGGFEAQQLAKELRALGERTGG